MEDGLSSPGYNHVVFDATGIKGVRDGKEYSISKKEWQKMHPQHRNIGCSECTFVQSKKTMFTFFVPRNLKEMASEKPVFVGKFTMPEWTGHSSFYIFRCRGCWEVCLDYAHGYTDGGYCYLHCDNCHLQLIITSDSDWGEELYAHEGIIAPPKNKNIFTQYFAFLREYFS